MVRLNNLESFGNLNSNIWLAQRGYKMSLDPIKTTQAITDSYLNYLSTTFRLKDSDLQRKFEQSLRIPDKFVKGPILEATPPFETSATIEELIQSGILRRNV